ncbi:MAG: helix-turn-helix transcriptional regulator [Bryobacterales bacterium]|nr:helix-turn-helix transcriptional regulator [Bryobacterales bacterium]
MPSPASLQLIQNPAAAAALLSPARLRILELLESPDSASGLARRLSLPRQQVNYHLRELEREGFVELYEERRKGNCVERVVRAKARSYLLSPLVLGNLAANPDHIADKFSAAYLLAQSARTIRDLSVLSARAQRQNKRIATFSLQVDVRFASAAHRHAFAEELTNAVAALVTRYHDEHADGGRTFRFLVGAHPALARAEEAEPQNLTLE